MTGERAQVHLVAGATYLPRYRLTGAEIARTTKRRESSGERSLAGPDEDALTLAVEAARRLPDDALARVRTVVFCSTTAPYLVKNNASAAAAALGLDPSVLAYDAGGALRSSIGVLVSARPGTLVLAGEVSTSRPGAATELTHGDAGAALLVGDEHSAHATLSVVSTHTEEIQDHWRDPRQAYVAHSEDRFPASRYLPLLRDAVTAGLPDSDHVVVSAASARMVKTAEKSLAKYADPIVIDGVGYVGAADQMLRVCEVLSHSVAGGSVLAVSLGDGVDIAHVRARAGVESSFSSGRTTSTVTPTYLDALTWRGLLLREPPRRPEPKVVSAPAALRGANWKYSLRASACKDCGFVSTPPQEVCLRCGSTEHGEALDMSRRLGKVRTFSVDRLAYSLNPPMVAAVIGFEGGGRLEVEITDTDPARLVVGAPVRMTFRRRHSSGGVHNYVWKGIVEEQDE
jgi:hydroxymethylglutaryl-CoA synthase